MPLITVVPPSRYRTIDLIDQGEINLTPSFTNYRHTNAFPASIESENIVNYLTLSGAAMQVSGVQLCSDPQYVLSVDPRLSLTAVSMYNGGVFSQGEDILLNKPIVSMNGGGVVALGGDNISVDTIPVSFGGGGGYTLAASGSGVLPLVNLSNGPVPYPADRDTNDPYLLTNNVFLLNVEGVDGSKIFTDAYGKTVLAAGNAQIKTGTSKFGLSSAYFDGAGSYLYVPTANTDFIFGTSDFTVEAWVYPLAQSTSPACIFDTHASAAGGGVALMLWRDGRFSLQLANSWSSYSTKSVNFNSWNHVALVSSAFGMSIYLNGSLIFSNSAWQPSQGLLTIGSTSFYRTADSSYKFKGYLDSFRITKGVARYRSVFVPPEVPFPTP